MKGEGQILELHRPRNAHGIVKQVCEQIADDKLPVRRTAQRLMSEGLDRHKANHAIASVLTGHINDLMREAGADGRPDESRAARDLNEAHFSWND